MLRFPFRSRWFMPVATLGGSVFLATAAHAQIKYYALGDSYTFGYQTSSAVVAGNGNAPLYGYVGTSTAANAGTNATFSGFLANRTGQSVMVTNLGIPGETTYSYLGQSSDHDIGLNTNYTSSSQTQIGVFDALPANSAAYVTLQLGGNDIVDYLYGQIAAGQSVTDAQIDMVETASFANLSTIVSDIKRMMPRRISSFSATPISSRGSLRPTARRRRSTVTMSTRFSITIRCCKTWRHRRVLHSLIWTARSPAMTPITPISTPQRRTPRRRRLRSLITIRTTPGTA